MAEIQAPWPSVVSSLVTVRPWICFMVIVALVVLILEVALLTILFFVVLSVISRVRAKHVDLSWCRLSLDFEPMLPRTPEEDDRFFISGLGIVLQCFRRCQPEAEPNAPNRREQSHENHVTVAVSSSERGEGSDKPLDVLGNRVVQYKSNQKGKRSSSASNASRSIVLQRKGRANSEAATVGAAAATDHEVAQMIRSLTLNGPTAYGGIPILCCWRLGRALFGSVLDLGVSRDWAFTSAGTK